MNLDKAIKQLQKLVDNFANEKNPTKAKSIAIKMTSMIEELKEDILKPELRKYLPIILIARKSLETAVILDLLNESNGTDIEDKKNTWRIELAGDIWILQELCEELAKAQS